jgi:L-ascorbate metabolism protein UlaG (beta-lactamase superfamily)
MPLIASPAIEITYIGGPTAIISIDGLNFITDPTFDAAGKDYKVGTVSLHKTKDPALQAAALPKLDVALVSHDQHPDNLDDSGRALLSSIPAVFTTKAGAQRLGGHATGLGIWEQKIVKSRGGLDLKITGTPARHGPVGIEKFTGDVVGFMISIATTGEDLVYVTGDTVWYEGTQEVANRFKPRVVVLFAGGAVTARGPFFLTMDTNDAISAASAFANAMIVPVHHDGWTHFTQNQDDLAKTFATLGYSARLRTVEPAAKLTFLPGASSR